MSKRALLVGINAYPDAPLNGCLNDIALVYKMLKDVFKFTEFKILDDRRATRKNIISGLQWLVYGLKPGDQAFWGYSGHGTQVACTTETMSYEIDRMDECICPIDMDWDYPLRDDDINKIIMGMNPKSNLLCHIDSCFSGTILKNCPKEMNGHLIKRRYLPPPLNTILDAGNMDINDDMTLGVSRATPGQIQLSTFLKDVSTQGNAVLISGCSDKQTSADAYINSAYHGAMTYFLVKVLRENKWRLPYRSLVTEMNKELDQNGFDQDPQLEAHKSLFDNLYLGGPAQ